MEVRALSISKKVQAASIGQIPRHRWLTGTMSHRGYMSLPFRSSLRTVLVRSNQLSFRPCVTLPCPRYSRPLCSGECARVCQVLSGEEPHWAPRPPYTVCRRVCDPTPKTLLKSDPWLLLLLIRPPSGLHCHQTPQTHCQINGVQFQCRRPEDLEWVGDDGE